MRFQLLETAERKAIRGMDYPYSALFDKTNGFFARWGHTEDDDPEWCPYGPELLDLENNVLFD